MDEQQLREILQEMCAGRTTFPTWTEFEQAGRRGLRKTVDRHGGARRWAAELGLQVSRPGPRPGSGGAPRQPGSPTRLAQAEASARARAKNQERERLQARALEMRRDGLPVAAIARSARTSRPSTPGCAEGPGPAVDRMAFIGRWDLRPAAEVADAVWVATPTRQRLRSGLSKRRIGTWPDAARWLVPADRDEWVHSLADSLLS